MKKLFALFIVHCSLFIAAAGAAGTYLGTSGYQSPQRYYQGAASAGYYQPQNVGASGYAGGNYYQQNQQPYYQPNPWMQNQNQNQNRQTAPARPRSKGAAEDGFFLDAGAGRQYAQWNFNMNRDGSIQNYSDLAWNVLDVKGGYRQGDILVSGGVQYGMQSGKSWMTDDDTTNGGLVVQQYDVNTGDWVFDTYQDILSISESSGGSLFGFNAGLGLMNKFGYGKTKITPSVGYRKFSYKLSTTNTHGVAVSSNYCRTDEAGERICPAYMWFFNNEMTWPKPDLAADEPDADGLDWWQVLGDLVATESFSFSQSGKSHIYAVSWEGPYVALDFESELNENNRVDARLEFGMPGYKSKGDQPYRPDWAHPVSLEDSAEMFGAMHIGAAAAWTTKVADNWGLSLGMTYDYYSVKGATAKTYFNQRFFEALYDADDIKDFLVDCPNWTCVVKKETNVFYRSIGARVGLVGRF